ncbi:rhodanese-like domain-containing protein [Gordonia sp. (in: high G+C Gram-positive bacteria)]|jgi:rhodanese-related sulfurtransferase|uniref:rhodanese-like domain-containing protein n=1 Tax=Gordonia sp. (in: high G+C Gram-positive bacteria) TaxID=84139 RepID=UPI001DE49719|nr:rhodanese-like domain-containing protein [Gordonia sp. (in: high G+C Gram-positive bacteria)]MCB1295170.1 rhodanese-like domain-containing protein [Gordonia sp. (in: high G+C Gram-positive bacteria)]HMS74275.1 rhodanese-like domain-containing protein [Gordonia sp. (in: high G+C Gram-positive bacteria)]HQV19381.1 rhodanese-like domain-containing protein [Gordonia sp. (in: high G+C Gram-positive bacteria)]
MEGVHAVTYAGDLTPQEAWDALEANPDAVLVDCRTRAEWNFVGVPDLEILGKRTVFIEWVGFPDGAPNQAFVAQLRDAGVRDSDEVIFICRSGHRSIGAAEAATAAGVAKAYNVLDGFEGALDDDDHRGSEGWRASNLPWRQS